MKIQQHDGVVVDAAGIPAGLCQALLEEEEVSREGEGGARAFGCGCPPSPPLYIGARGAHAPLGDPI